MIISQYPLTEPKVIERRFRDISFGEGVIVRPQYLSVCKADLRYFLGQRDHKVLREKLPLVLIHEACGSVVYDNSGKLAAGTKVVMLPNIPGKDSPVAENYRLDSRFRSSKADGFLQELLVLDEGQVVPYNNIPHNIAAFSELISVGVHAVESFKQRVKTSVERLALWGDGSVGYIVACLLKKYFPKAELSVIGVQPGRLALFSMADNVILTDKLISQNCFDHCFECVGGQASGNAVNQIIDTIRPEGVISLLGVSEEPVPVNTRMVLEKGLTLLGRSSSRREDFIQAIDFMESDEEFVNRLSLLVSDEVVVDSIDSLETAFDVARSSDFKTILKWEL